MSGLAYWILGSIVGLMGFVGLFLASEGNRQGDDLVYWGGLTVFSAAVLAEFWLIKLWFDLKATPLRAAPVKADVAATVPGPPP